MSTARPPSERSPADALRRPAATVVGLAGVFCIIVLAARSGGGYFPVEYLAMGVAALLVASVVLVLLPTPPRFSWRAVVAVVGLAGYAAWIGVSSSWSPSPSSAVAEYQRTVAYVAILVLGLVVAGTGRGARGLVVVTWAGLAGIAIAGVISRLLPGLELAPQIDPVFNTYRLNWPISYWNAQGTAAAMAIPVAVGLASDRQSPVALRAAAAATVPMTVLCILLTVSRGSILALAVAVVALVALSRRPLQTVVIAICCAAPAAVGVLLATGQPAIVDDPKALPALSSAGPRLFFEVLALGALAAVASVVSFAAVRRLERRRQEEQGDARATTPGLRTTRQRSPSWVPLAVVGASVVLLLGLGVLADRFDGKVTAKTSGLRTFIDDQRQAFLDPRSQTGEGLERLGSAGGSRSDLYRVAIDQFEGAPIRGAGTGAFPIRWLRDRETPQPVQNAHSLPLEALAETGLVGFALLGAVIGALFWGILLARRRPTVLPRSLAAGASAAIVAFLASCAIDWTWQIASLTAAMLALGAPLLGTSSRASRSTSRGSPASGAAPGGGAATSRSVAADFQRTHERTRTPHKDRRRRRRRPWWDRPWDR